MTLYSLLFYILAVLILAATVLAVTRRNLVHSIIYLVLSFFGTALLFYLFGAPLLAALEVIIYAGAIMVLFLFIVMMLRVDSPREQLFPLSRLIPAGVMGLIYLAAGVILVFTDSDSRAPLQAALATPREFGHYVFQQHWLAVEIISLLLLIAVIGVLHIGKNPVHQGRHKPEEKP
jgi:NADH-quinone oxidoreductase subunit J